jgi:RHS repeat-associated protein
LGVPPGPPTQHGIYATPEFTGDPYPSEVIKPAEENQEPPEGWPRNPIFNAPGDVPGPPVQFGSPVEPETVKSGEGFTGIGLPENDIFYFHPDHLGSTSYITSKNGSISQHVEYIAFGEVLFEEHSSSFSSPYLFNGKELDRETNLSYYGARYLDMKTSLWLSVDVLAEKMPNYGAYVFSKNNAVRFIDPDGRAPIDITIWGWDSYSKEYRKTVVIKSSIYNVDYYSKNIAAPTAVASRAKWEPTTIYGFDLWATISGKPDAIRFNMTAELHAGGVNVGGTLGVVAPLRGKDKGGLFFYGPSAEKGWDIGFEKPSYSFEIGGVLGVSLIYDSDKKYDNFNRFTFEGVEESIGGSYGVFSASLFKSSDDSYSGFSFGAGLSKGVSRDTKDKRGDKNVSTSGAKLIEELSILPGEK